MADIIIDIASEFTGQKAFKKAEDSTEKLMKNVKKLAKTLGIAYGSQQILAFGKASIKAAAADQKAQQQLALALKNVGLGRDAASSEAYIQSLQSEFGIVDDKLRPAYQTLAVATRDSAEAQKLLNLSLDISASTGKDLGTVTAALSKAYLGNNTSLSKLGVGISKADLKAKSFNDIVDQLSVTFAGSATQAANTFAGQMDRLSVSSNNAKEIIGTGLIDALKEVGGDNSIAELGKDMESVALYVADAIRGVGILINKINSIPGIGAIAKVIANTSAIGMLASMGRKSREAKGEKFAQGAPAELAALSKYSIVQDKVVKNAKTLTKLSAQQIKDLKLKAAIEKANLALGKGTEIFDMDKIQIAAALTSQAEQLGKATTGAQVLAIANDVARLKVKQDILALEDAIASNDEKAITAATAKLNEDMKILGALQNQSIKLLDIKSLLESLKPKDLINIDNLNEALRLLGLINLASTGSKNTPAGYSAGTGASANQYPNNVGNGLYGMQTPSSIAATNLNTELLGGVVSVIGDNLVEFTKAIEVITTRQSNGREWSSGFSPNITINTGVGDPNAIAEAIDTVLTDAVNRGTLKGYVPA